MRFWISVKSKAAIDRLRCPITRCSPYAKGFTKHVIPLGPLAQSILDKRDLKDRTYVFGKWDTGFSNYTHLKESLDEKLKFNEGWWFHDLRRTGKPR